MECVQVKEEPDDVGECSLEMRLDEYPTNTTIKCEGKTCVSHTCGLFDLHDHIQCGAPRLLDKVETCLVGRDHNAFGNFKLLTCTHAKVEASDNVRPDEQCHDDNDHNNKVIDKYIQVESLNNLKPEPCQFVGNHNDDLTEELIKVESLTVKVE